MATWVDCYAVYISQLFVLVCELDGECVGIAPLYVRAGSLLRLRRKTLMFTGTGEMEVDESFAEYMAPICVPTYRHESNIVFAEKIGASREFQDISLVRVRRDLLQPLVEQISTQRKSLWDEQNLGACFAMASSIPQAFANMSARQRSTMKRKLKRLNDQGFTLEVAKDEASRAKMFSEMISLHEQAWNGRGRTGVFEAGRFRKFHDSLSASLLLRKELLLLAVRIADSTVAVIYALCDRSACHYYQSGLDVNRDPRVSIGLVAHLLAAEQAGMMGLSRYDLMLSSSPSYKARLGQAEVELWSFNSQTMCPLRRMSNALTRVAARVKKHWVSRT